MDFQQYCLEVKLKVGSRRSLVCLVGLIARLIADHCQPTTATRAAIDVVYLDVPSSDYCYISPGIYYLRKTERLSWWLLSRLK